MPSFPENGPALRSFRISSNQKTWDEIRWASHGMPRLFPCPRLPRLRAHLSKSAKTSKGYAPVAFLKTSSGLCKLALRWPIR